MAMNVEARDVVVRIAARGDGVSASGKHVPQAAPGDWLDGEGTLHHGSHHQAAPCAHYGRCGGCQLQHADDAALAAYLVSRVETALDAQGLKAREIREPHLSPPGSRRRVSLSAQRIGGSLALGFNEAGSHRLIDLKQCLVMRSELLACLAPLRALLRGLMKPRSAAAKVQLTLVDQGVDVLLSGVEAWGLEAHDAIMAFCEGRGIARLAIDNGDGPEDRWVPQPVTATFGGVAVPLPHGAFLQATVDGEAQLIAAVREAAGGAAHIADLFSGVGTFAFPLSVAAKVHAVEAARDVVMALQLAANRAVRPITAEHRDLYRRPLTPTELAAFDAVVLDPPRAGAEAQMRELAASIVPIIAYVSCNPASFARDAAVLVTGGYTLDWVQPIGQFRWSTHMELAARFVRYI
ncbi:MAG: class I SAM-dependent RNA methyltransferase [Sphingopyxis sp.]